MSFECMESLYRTCRYKWVVKDIKKPNQKGAVYTVVPKHSSDAVVAN
jgi:hypothetical protein